LHGVIHHQGDLRFGGIVEHLIVGHPHQLLADEGTQRTPVSIIRCGELRGERGQLSRSQGEEPQVTITFG
jgi:hypothetical protein